MKLIVGLGNPGPEYQETRHNIGRHVMEIMAAGEYVRFSQKKSLHISLAHVKWGDEVILAYPLDYMNLSGEAVSRAVKYFEIRPADQLLIVVDDADLPFGRLRLRAKGSSGGHNGLKSIEACLGTQEYSRLRVGIGRNLTPNAGSSGRSLKHFVLEGFTEDEKRILPEFCKQAAEACRLWQKLPISSAMSAVNGSIN